MVAAELCVPLCCAWRNGSAHTNPALVLSPRYPILHGQSGAERFGLTVCWDAEGKEGREFRMQDSSADFCSVLAWVDLFNGKRLFSQNLCFKVGSAWLRAD